MLLEITEKQSVEERYPHAIIQIVQYCAAILATAERLYFVRSP